MVAHRMADMRRHALIAVAPAVIFAIRCRRAVGGFIPERGHLPSAVPLWKVIAGQPMIGKTPPGLSRPGIFLCIYFGLVEHRRSAGAE
jgi:hypothetical protein